ncbi:MAG TPA: sigma factor-like helix-turn-helix DNA-binding protein [Polyangiaceae bacterium]|nr:sigma factor-like helix-turn-helix DNA-binding protein [Polyangiaceae bacterium]
MCIREQRRRLAESLGGAGGSRYPALDGCVDNGAPGAACRHTECRYHLDHRGYWEHAHRPTHHCSIDVANEGPHTLDEVALFMGVSGERVRQIEEEAFEQLKHSATLKGLHDESPY